MIYHDHSRDLPRGDAHAIFGASNYYWTNDQGPEDALQRLYGSYATSIGTIVHEVAANCIKQKKRRTKSGAKEILEYKLLENDIPRGAFDLNLLAANFVNYVNDAIGYVMVPELILFYSKYCFGTTDALVFDERNKLLRIHDLKTGITPAKFTQLEVYAAYFCLDYDIKPDTIDIELRIYQGGEVLIEKPSADIIFPIIDSTIWHNDVAVKAKEG